MLGITADELNIWLRTAVAFRAKLKEPVTAGTLTQGDICGGDKWFMAHRLLAGTPLMDVE